MYTQECEKIIQGHLTMPHVVSQGQVASDSENSIVSTPAGLYPCMAFR